EIGERLGLEPVVKPARLVLRIAGDAEKGSVLVGGLVHPAAQLAGSDYPMHFATQRQFYAGTQHLRRRYARQPGGQPVAMAEKENLGIGPARLFRQGQQRAAGRQGQAERARPLAGPDGDGRSHPIEIDVGDGGRRGTLAQERKHQAEKKESLAPVYPAPDGPGIKMAPLEGRRSGRWEQPASGGREVEKDNAQALFGLPQLLELLRPSSPNPWREPRCSLMKRSNSSRSLALRRLAMYSWKASIS